MIGFIEGKIKYLGSDYLIVETGGSVGYRVYVTKPLSAYNAGKRLGLYTYTYVRENEISLYGFEDTDSMKLFELLLEVNGVGPKLAKNLIQELGIESIIEAILSSDANGLRVSGVGEKTAKKIVLELSDKISKISWQRTYSRTSGSEKSGVLNKKLNEAEQGLISLGYSRRDVKNALSKIEKAKLAGFPIEKIIKIFLSKM